MNLLNEITETWKLEAKQENNSRYFFHIDESTRILNGERFYVIGRKGSGKTAIGEYVLNLNKTHENYNVFAERLSFKSFPFNELYDKNNVKYTQPNQYITIWKYIIYSCICRLMVKNHSIDDEVRSVLEKLYPPDPIKNLSRLIDKWTTKEFGAQILGIGANIKVDKISMFENLTWIEKTNILEDIIEQYIDNSKYYVVFDELDEDYRIFENIDTQNQYIYLITSLFKAVQDVKSIFKDKKNIICPIVFLRDDIYSLVQDTDKNKWGDFMISLEWNEDKIKKMLAFRISKAIDENGDVLTFKQAWEKLFKNEPVSMGDRARKKMNIFDFITRSTQLRPRDYIKYIQVCAEKTLSDGFNIINPTTVKKVDKGFSNYLKDEIIDEVHAQLPYIQTIFSIISQIRKQDFTIKEFKDIYLSYYKKGTVKEGNVDNVLQMLFNFSVIGNRPNNRPITFFKYNNSEARFNFRENITVHRGLFKALQIL
jgi:Cdc6-like AAA superfamily ATPase